MTLLETAKLIKNKGIVGAASFGFSRQVTIIEQEIWEKVMRQLSSDLPPETRRANLMVKGIRLKESKGKILTIGSCQIEIMGETTPCDAMDMKLPGLQNSLKPDWNGGVYGSVLNDGEIAIGNVVCWGLE